MDWEMILTFIKTVGLPGTMCIILLYMVKKYLSDAQERSNKIMDELQELKEEIIKEVAEQNKTQESFQAEWRTTVRGYVEVNRNTTEFTKSATRALQSIESEQRSLTDWIRRLEVTLTISSQQKSSKDSVEK